MDRLVDLLNSGQIHNVIVIAGAGISVASGIPDFRSPNTGLYASIKDVASLSRRRPTFEFEIEVFEKDPKPFWWIFSKMWPATAGASPTAFHFFLSLLCRKQLLLRCYTQNVDGLENVAGVPPEKIVYAHGVLNTCRCLRCRKTFPFSFCMNVIRENLANPDNSIETTVVPRCSGCNSQFVKPDVVFFREDLPEGYYDMSPGDVAKCDLLIIAGTSLEVYPFAGLPGLVSAACPRFLVNMEKVKEVGRGLKKFLNMVKSILTLGFMDFSGIFEFGGGRDWFIGGDLQEGAMQIFKGLGWEAEFAEVKERMDAAESTLRREAIGE
jgi:NAD-dependent SIR2 family protein deacetylase